jgi:hypothetical protein
MDCYWFGLLALQELALADPNAVLAAARSAERQRAGDDPLVEVPGAVPRAGIPRIFRAAA